MTFIFAHLGEICSENIHEPNLIYHAASTMNIEEFCRFTAKNKYDEESMTKALAFSIVNKNYHAAHVLIKADTDVNRTIRSSKKDLILLRMGVRYTPLLLAIDYDCRRLVKLLLENEADPNGKGRDVDNSDLIPLQEALYFGNIAMIRDLIKYGSDVDYIHNIENGEPVIHKIIRTYKTIDIIGLLIRNHKTNINIVSENKQSLLHYAIRVQNLNIARYLINLGIDINLENSDGDTALDYTLRYLNILEDSIIKRIVKLKAADCYVSKKNLMAVDWESSDVKSFYEKCSKQIEFMKKTSIGESNLTLYRVLHESDYKLTLVAKHLEKDVILKTCCFGRAYLYKKTLTYRLTRAVERRNVLIEIENVIFDIFCRVLVLPHTFVRQLFYYLSIPELEILLVKN